MPKNARIAVLLLVSLAACRRDNVRALDAVPELPDAIEFGLLPVNQQKVVPLTIANSGKINLEITDLVVREPFNVEVPPEPVLPGSSNDVLVKFQPTQPGEVNERLTLQTTSSELPVVSVKLHGIAFLPQLDVLPDRLDFGDVNVGDHKALTFQITNKAPTALNPSVRPLDPASDFSVAPQGSLGTLESGASVTVTVVFTPSVAGPAASGIVLACPVCAPRQVQLTGNGIGVIPPATDGGTAADAGPEPSCTLRADPPRVDFGKVKPGATASQVVKLSSVGTGSCVLQTPYLAAGSDPSLSAAPLAGIELQPSGSTSFTAVYAPDDKTPTQVSAKVVVVSNDKDHSPLEVPLTGELDPPPPPPPPPGKLVVTPASLSFTAQVPAAPDAQTLSLQNQGGSPLSWTATSSDPKVTLSSSSGSLAPNAPPAAVTVSVAAETVAGSRTATLVFDAGAAGQVTVPVQITFTAAPPPPPAPALLDVQPLSLTFTAQAPGAPLPQSITVANKGGVSLSWTGSVDDSGVTFTPSSGTLAGSASQPVQVSVAASQFAGTRSATLTIDAAAAGKKQVAISIVFTQPPPPPPPPQYGGSAWPKWHHDNASSGLSHVDTSSNQGNVFWQHKIAPPSRCRKIAATDWLMRCGTYVNSPVLDDGGNVIQLGGDGNLYKVDRTGAPVWTAPAQAPWIAANEGTPTVVKDGSIFVMTAGEVCSATNPDPCTPHFYKVTSDGVSTAIDKNPAAPADGWDSSPAIDADGTLYVANDDHKAVAVFDQRGVLQREIPLNPPGDLETQSAALADGIGYWSGNGHLWALGATAQLWSFSDPAAPSDHAQAFHNIKSSPALTPDGKVIFTFVYETTVNGTVKQITDVFAFKAGGTMNQLWQTTLGPTTPQPGLSPGPDSQATVADALHYRSGITSPAVGPDGTIYVGHCDGLYALWPDTGKVKWGAGMAEVVSSPAVGKDGTVYVGSMDGNLYALRPDGSIKWQVPTGGQLNSSPAIGADGTVYAMSDDGYLYAIH